MSFWIRPTTADIGIRAFGRNQNDLLREMTLGMQSILLDDDNDLNSLTRKAARWEVMHDGDVEILVVKWLDEVLYRAEVHNEYLVDCQPMIRDGIIESQVSFVSKDDVNYEIEIKAVTTHEFAFRYVSDTETVSSEWEEIPSFNGPGWIGDVVFDI
ncbi:MAG: archease [Candidatus Thermoplasmatota archaeon]|nr:archease [Candidatus Thermoplasmatota archaeon]